MCGRVTVTSQAQNIAEFFAALNCSDVPTSYNISPTQTLPAVRVDPEQGQRTLIDLHWGLIPFWAKDVKIANKLINARSETLSEKPSFRAAYKYRRCILPVDGFYEWKRQDGAKQPFYFKSPKDEPLPFAGLWESWTSPEGSELHSCAIITTEANEMMQPVHHRMPAMVMPEHRDAWLDPKFYDEDALREVTRAPAEDVLTCYPVSKFVNYSANDGPHCIEPLDDHGKPNQGQASLF